MYEITIISKENLAGPAADGFIRDALKDADKVIKTQIVGEKQLAYKINKESKGFFLTAVFECPGEKLSALNKKLSLNDDILRFLITSYQEPEAPKEKLELPMVIKEAPAKEKELPEEKVEEIKTEKAPEVSKPKKAKTEVKKEKDVPAKKPMVTKDSSIKEAVSDEERLEALDKKLDELLKE
jgi:small subunit ribosomal protein S6